MLSYPADIPEIIRSHRKDEEYISFLKDLGSRVAEKVLSPQLRAKWFTELEIGPELLYFAVTTLPALQTLGEEYIGLVQVGDASRKTIVPTFRRLALVLTQVSGAYFLKRTVKKLLEVRELRSAFNWTEVLDKLGQLHLAVFFLSGTYYHFAKRILGVKYLSLRPQSSGDESTYRLFNYLGVAALAQIAVHSLILLYRNLPKLHSAKENPILNESYLEENSESIAKSPQENQSTFSCSYCLEFRADVACLPCGHLFCWNCSLEQAGITGTCGLCRQAYSAENVVPIFNY